MSHHMNMFITHEYVHHTWIWSSPPCILDHRWISLMNIYIIFISDLKHDSFICEMRHNSFTHDIWYDTLVCATWYDTHTCYMSFSGKVGGNQERGPRCRKGLLWAMSHTCHTFEWVMLHIRMRHVTRLNALCNREVCCSVLQCVAVECVMQSRSVLQCVAVCCSW